MFKDKMLLLKFLIHHYNADDSSKRHYLAEKIYHTHDIFCYGMPLT